MAINNTLLADLIKQVGGIRSKVDAQDSLLNDIFHLLKKQTPPPPSFTEDDRKGLKMVAEFGIMTTTAIAELEAKEQQRVDAEKAKVETKAAKAKSIVETTTTDRPTSPVDDDKEEKDREENTSAEGGNSMPVMKMTMTPPSSFLLLVPQSSPPGLNQLSSVLNKLM